MAARNKMAANLTWISLFAISSESIDRFFKFFHRNSSQIGSYVTPKQDGCRKQNGRHFHLNIVFGYIF
jgi:hypothetical protein